MLTSRRKRKISLFYIVLAILSVYLIEPKTTNGLGNKLALTSENLPADEYAKDVYYDHLFSVLSFSPHLDQSHDNYFMGTGIDLQNNEEGHILTRLYPIFNQSDITLVLKISNNDGYFTSSMSENLAFELNASLSSKDSNVIRLFFENQNIFVQEFQNEQFITEHGFPDKSQISQSSDRGFSRDEESLIPILNNALEEYHFERGIEPNYVFNYTYAPKDYSDRQTDKPWCLGYVSAQAIRTMASRTDSTAQIALFNQLGDKESMGRTHVNSYMRAKGIKILIDRLVYGTPSTSTIVDNIIAK